MADAAVEELKPMLSPNGKLTPLKATNRLEAMDAAINLRDVQKILSAEQSLQTQEGLVRKFVLKYARASDVCEQVKELVARNRSPAGRRSPARRSRCGGSPPHGHDARRQSDGHGGAAGRARSPASPASPARFPPSVAEAQGRKSTLRSTSRRTASWPSPRPTR